MMLAEGSKMAKEKAASALANVARDSKELMV